MNLKNIVVAVGVILTISSFYFAMTERNKAKKASSQMVEIKKELDEAKRLFEEEKLRSAKYQSTVKFKEIETRRLRLQLDKIKERR